MIKTLNKKELAVRNSLVKKARFSKPKTRRPIMIVLGGLVGSGKSTVAKELAKETGAVIISADQVRVALRKVKQSYDKVREIYLNIGKEAVKKGNSVIVDSDFTDAAKRNQIKTLAIKTLAKRAKLPVYFIRVICDIDVAVGRIINNSYSGNDLFGGAATFWRGANRGAVVKIREMWRRTPFHYQWTSQNGGQFKLKKLLFSIFATIDTTNDRKWKVQLKKLVKKIITK